MANRFPGIDPFVEAEGDWPDFHLTFMSAWREAIADQLPDAYVARLEERVSIVEYEEERERRSSPDITISKSPARTATSLTESGVATLDPATIRVLIEEEIRQTYLQIVRHSDRKLVAVLELLSPSNKVGDGRAQYLAKRQAVLLSDAHLFELDLLLGSKPLPTEDPFPPGHFHALVSRAGQRPVCQVYTWWLDQRLPALPIPLLAPDPDIVVDLAGVLETTYRRGRYEKTINYQRELNLPLSPEYLAWVKARASGAS
jgi:hypothetical protein